MAIKRESKNATKETRPQSEPVVDVAMYSTFRVRLPGDAVADDQIREDVTTATLNAVVLLLKKYPDLKLEYKIEHSTPWIAVTPKEQF